MRQTLPQIEGRETFLSRDRTIDETGTAGGTAICACAAATAAGGALLALRRLRGEVDLGVRPGPWIGASSAPATGGSCYDGSPSSTQRHCLKRRLLIRSRASSKPSSLPAPLAACSRWR